MAEAFGWTALALIGAAVLWIVVCGLTNGRPYWPERKS
jgi:hypothetical protein